MNPRASSPLSCWIVEGPAPSRANNSAPQPKIRQGRSVRSNSGTAIRAPGEFPPPRRRTARICCSTVTVTPTSRTAPGVPWRSAREGHPWTTKGPDSVRCVSEASREYRQRARRLRHVYAGRPEKLQPALRSLAAECDGRDAHRDAGTQHVTAIRRAGGTPRAASPGAGASLFSVIRPSGDAIATARKFADTVEAELHGGILPWSRRLRLLRLARKMGIERFEAGLIIAAVQHHRPPPRAGDSGSSRRRPCITPAAVACAIQAVIASAVWWLLSA